MKDDFNTPKRCDASENTTARPMPIMTLDVEKYQAYLDDADMTQAQKDEFLQALWSIIVSFVDLGFGVHPLQAVCGEDEHSESNNVNKTVDMLVSNAFNTNKNE
jgi:hypothetical protein